jgi:hypothetical protein
MIYPNHYKNGKLKDEWLIYDEVGVNLIYRLRQLESYYTNQSNIDLSLYINFLNRYPKLKPYASLESYLKLERK